MSQKQFYMVWRGRGSVPTTQHETLETAEAEASRLARKEPGEVFYVLASVCEIKTDEPKITKSVHYPPRFEISVP